jgi:hypothetical protein
MGGLAQQPAAPEAIGNIPPTEAEACYYAQVDVFDIAA